MPHNTSLRQGLWLGLLGMAIFAATLPMTRMAVGSVEAPAMSGTFIACARAVLAAALSGAYLLARKAAWPRRADWPALAAVALGVVLGFPLLTSLAMRHVQAVHASVILGVLPLATASMGAVLQRQRPSLGFWLCALLGSALVVVYALLRSGQGGLQLAAADGLLLLAMLCAAVGYAYGARLSLHLPAAQVICWALLLALPVTLPGALLCWPQQTLPSAAWWALAYLGAGSMWLGFFAWYRGLALGGTVRVSQVQLLQPFLSMVLAIPLLGERLDALTLAFGLAVIAVVFTGRTMPVYSPSSPKEIP